MRKWLKVLLAFAASVSAPSLNAWDADNIAHVSLGYRQDNQSWTFKIPKTEPVFRSSVALDEIHILDLGIHYKTVVNNCFYLRARANWGWVLDGMFREKFTEYLEPTLSNNFPVLEAHSRSLIDGRYTADADIAFGYPFYFCCCKLRIAPVVGYGYHEQNYRFDENHRINYFDPDDNGSLGLRKAAGVPKELIIVDITDSDTKFISRWWGPFIGFDVNYLLADCVNLYSQFEWHLSHFKGHRHSKLGIDEFDDFQKATRHAHGFYWKLGLDYELCNCWTFGFYGTYEDFSAAKSSSNKIFELVPIENEEIIPICLTSKMRFKAKRHGYSLGVQVGRVF